MGICGILWWRFRVVLLSGCSATAVTQQGGTYGTHSAAVTWNSQQIHRNRRARSWCSSVTHSGPVGTLGRSSEEVRALIDSLRSVAGFHSTFCEQLQLICIAHLISHTQSPTFSPSENKMDVVGCDLFIPSRFTLHSKHTASKPD